MSSIMFQHMKTTLPKDKLHYSYRPYFTLSPYSTLHHSMPPSSPWTTKPVTTLLGGSSIFPPGMVMPSYPTPTGLGLLIWNLLQMPREVLVMASFTWINRLLISGFLSSRTNPFNGKTYILVCLLWGHQLSGKKLPFHCSNQATVGI